MNKNNKTSVVYYYALHTKMITQKYENQPCF